MNALYVIHKYFEIKEGKKPATPITVFFGAKAAPAYIIAKDIIHLILCLQQIINNDPEVSPYLKVFMVENYNVTMAEKMIPACKGSAQRSGTAAVYHHICGQYSFNYVQCPGTVRLLGRDDPPCGISGFLYHDDDRVCKHGL